MLQSIVDPRARNSAYAVFQLVSTIVGSLAPQAIGPLVESTGLDPEKPEDQKKYGELLAYFTMIPAAMAIPCFYMAGRVYKKFV